MGNTILIADDNPPDLELLSLYFREGGFTVFAAKDCGEAIQLAGRHMPDCFLLDYCLGAETAEKICGFIRGDARLVGTPHHNNERRAGAGVLMCGICGFANYRNEELLKGMASRLAHRGPDEDGFFSDAEKVSLGMRRLKIIDLATVGQPISNEDEHMCNGGTSRVFVV